jgi:hypothetical protein
MTSTTDSSLAPRPGARPPAERAAPLGLPPLGTKFRLGPALTDEQRGFLAHYGYLHFEQALDPEEVQALRDEQDRLQARWLEEGRRELRGTPLFWGRGPDGEPLVQRMPFCSSYSEKIRALVRDARFAPLRELFGVDVRVGDEERDGVVMNRYLNVPGSGYPRLGWHTDGLRDLFLLRRPQQKLNFGLHLDDIAAEDGGLRLIPGTHTQGFWRMCFRKLYFLDHRPDPEEIVVETRAGDLTIHDGRLWHRVERSAKTGWASQRRSLYVPYMTGPREPRSEATPMPLYHRFLRLLREGLGLGG